MFNLCLEKVKLRKNVRIIYYLYEIVVRAIFWYITDISNINISATHP